MSDKRPGTSALPVGHKLLQEQQPQHGRAASAGVIDSSARVARYEELTLRLKQLIQKEKLNLRMVKTLISGEIEQRNLLEKYLRLCVDDVKAEITKKRGEQKNSYCKLIFLVVTIANRQQDEKGTPGLL